jgi:hypothetical protein
MRGRKAVQCSVLLALLALTSPVCAADSRAHSAKGLYVTLAVDLDSYWQNYSRMLGDKVNVALKSRGIDNTVQITPSLISICLPNAAQHDAAQRVVITTLKPEAKHGNFYLIPFGASCFEISLGKAERKSVGTGNLAQVFKNERQLLEQNGIDSSTLEFLPDGNIGIALQGYTDKKDVEKLFVPELRIVETRPLGAR